MPRQYHPLAGTNPKYKTPRKRIHGLKVYFIERPSGIRKKFVLWRKKRTRMARESRRINRK